LLYKILLSCVAYIGTKELVDCATDGFSLSKIQKPVTWDQTLLADPPGVEVAHILDQPFHYLASGHECFAFASEDGRFILKFFKLQPLRFTYFRDALKSGEELPFFQKLITAHKDRLQRTFSSCKIAYDLLKEETGLLYFHHNPIDSFCKLVTITDPSGIAHRINLNTTPFILQKRAELAYPYLLSSDQKRGEELIDSLFALIEARREKGIMDRDPAIYKNFGYDGERLIEIDVGSFSINETDFTETLKLEMDEFYNFLKNNRPELALYLKEKIFLTNSSFVK